MLKHLPDDVLATFQEELLYSKKPVIIKGNTNNTIADRRNHIAAAGRNSNTDSNINDRIAKFNNNNQLFDQKVYRIPLKYLVDIGLINLPTEFNVKFTFNLKKLQLNYLKQKQNWPMKQEGSLQICQQILQMQVIIFMQLHICNTSS